MRRNGSLPAFWRRCTYEGSDLFYRGSGEISPQEYGAYDRRETTATGLYKEYGLKLAFVPRAAGEHGKPFLTLQPKIHYNISHSGKYVMCIIAGEEVGIDVQEHKKVNYERMLTRMVPADMVREILESEQMEKAFFTQWVLREAYIKWTGEGLSKDLRKISLDKGSYLMLEMEPGYSGAVWSRDPLELRWVHEEIQLP